MALDLCEDRGPGSCSNLLSFWLYLFLLCLSRQTSHLVWLWIAGFRQSLQSPRDLASARLVWALRRCSSFRSGVCDLFCSYFRPFCALALAFLGFGSGWRSVSGVAFLVGFLTFGFQRGSCTGGCLCLWGHLPAFCGLGNGKVYSKVRPIARGSGDPEPFPSTTTLMEKETRQPSRPSPNPPSSSPQRGSRALSIHHHAYGEGDASAEPAVTQPPVILAAAGIQSPFHPPPRLWRRRRVRRMGKPRQLRAFAP